MYLTQRTRKNIDFTRFSEAGYVLPGQYLLDVIVNGQSISPASLQISFVEPALSGDKAEKKIAAGLSDIRYGQTDGVNSRISG